MYTKLVNNPNEKVVNVNHLAQLKLYLESLNWVLGPWMFPDGRISELTHA